MGRHKTVSDEQVLAVARRVFEQQGDAASTREIAAEVGVSEAVLYQRFKSKNALFLAAMLPCPPDFQAILGPPEPPDDAREYLMVVVDRLAGYFAECVPAGVRIMMHPAFDHDAIASSDAMAGTAKLTMELAERLRALHARGRISNPSVVAAAGALIALAHDSAVRGILSGRHGHDVRHDLVAMAEIVIAGIGPAGPARVARRTGSKGSAKGAGRGRAHASER